MSEDPKIIDAHQIVLSDESGATRIFMNARGPGGPVVQVRGEDRSSIELRALPDKGGVALILQAPRRHVIVRLEDQGGAFISLTDAEGKHSVEIDAPREGGLGAVRIYRDGEVIASLGEKNA